MGVKERVYLCWPRKSDKKKTSEQGKKIVLFRKSRKEKQKFVINGNKGERAEMRKFGMEKLHIDVEKKVLKHSYLTVPRTVKS